MSFNYHKHKDGAHNESFWTSYSDLFLGLSTIFLLLYVTASLRTGTDGLKNQIENQKLMTQVSDLQSQLKMYESIKKDYLQNEAPKDEIQEYTELMDKLTLLQEEAKDEKDRLRQQALENEMKEKALNKYQQMVRNIINANKVAKTKIVSRNDIIEEQDDEIETQDKEISKLEKNVRAKQRQIAENEKKIADANAVLEEKIQELDKAYKKNKMTAKTYEKKMAQLKQENEEKVGALEGQLEKNQEEARQQISALEAEFAQQKAKERAAFEAQLQKEKLGAAERAAREEEFKRNAAAKEKELAGKIAGLSGQVKGLSDQLKSTEGKLESTKGQLNQAKAEMDARREVAREIKKAFEKAGIKADVDMGTGEVLIDFGQAYFDNDSSKLKEEMKSILEKAVPVYSKSLFGNPKVAKKISNVEIVGFASPTYRGKFIDPSSTKKSDKEALKYNMDLSYRRAKSIFNHILDENHMNFEYQQELVPMLKVSGRSFLEVMKVNRNVASGEDFCKVNDCKKSQRVIIRFSMDGKH